MERARKRRFLRSRVEVILAQLLVRRNSCCRMLAPDLRKVIEVFHGGELRAGSVVELGVDDLDCVVRGVGVLRGGEGEFLEVAVEFVCEQQG